MKKNRKINRHSLFHATDFCLLQLGNLAQIRAPLKFQSLILIMFYDNYSSEETIQGRKLFKGGNY